MPQSFQVWASDCQDACQPRVWMVWRLILRAPRSLSIACAYPRLDSQVVVVNHSMPAVAPSYVTGAGQRDSGDVEALGLSTPELTGVPRVPFRRSASSLRECGRAQKVTLRFGRLRCYGQRGFVEFVRKKSVRPFPSPWSVTLSTMRIALSGLSWERAGGLLLKRMGRRIFLGLSSPQLRGH